MLTLQQINNDPDGIIRGLEKKHFADASQVVVQVLDLDKRRRETQQQKDDVSAQMNQLSKSIGTLMGQGKQSEAEVVKQQTADLKTRIGELETSMASIEEQLKTLLYTIPNVPYAIVPEGTSAPDNVVVKLANVRGADGHWQVRELNKRIADLSEDESKVAHCDFAKLPHWELAKKYNLIDFDLGVKISGAGFPVYIGKGAQLQRALINYFLTQAGKAGYTEIQPPTVVNPASGYGTGQLPDKEGQMYHCEVDDLYLIPTAEVPVTNLYRDVILDETQLPIKNCAYTECFRREAGSYGKDVRGLNRLHEFSKVEIVRIDTPEHSDTSHKEMLAHVESLLQGLDLPYRILRLCGGDMSFTAALCYDFEIYSEAQGRWLEVSSTSNFDTFQANRLKCRYRRTSDKKTTLCHTLNGSALALPRIVAGILEDNQTPEGIKMPEILVPFLGFDYIR